jgi:hypothetical protein
MLAALPAHVGQRSVPGVAPFTAAQRAAALGVRGLQYGTVGVVTGALGAASVQALVALREAFDPGFSPPATVQSVWGTGTAWGAFMALSSNLRYNGVNLVEEALYCRSPAAGKLGSVVLRLVNNWAGAAQWVGVTRTVSLDVPWRCAAPAAGS